MATELFPVISVQAEATTTTTLPMATEIKWDFGNDLPVFSGGEPVIVTGTEAVKVWAWNALNTVRFRHEIYGWDYGNEVENLIGKPWTVGVKEAEAKRYVEECLLQSDYIESLDDVETDFTDGKLTLSATINTIYGSTTIEL